MTRKHYKIVADSLQQARKRISLEIKDGNDKQISLETITQLEMNLINLFAADNSRFSVTKFLAASN